MTSSPRPCSAAAKAGFDETVASRSTVRIGYVLCAFLSSDRPSRTDRMAGSSRIGGSALISSWHSEIACGPDFSRGHPFAGAASDSSSARCASSRSDLMHRGPGRTSSDLDVALGRLDSGGARRRTKPSMPRDRCSTGSWTWSVGNVRRRRGRQDPERHGDRTQVPGTRRGFRRCIGRACELHHDFPAAGARRIRTFAVDGAAGDREHLRAEGLGPAFVDYMKTWKGFVTA